MKKPKLDSIDLFVEGSIKGLKGNDVFEHIDNQQRLSMNELQEKIFNNEPMKKYWNFGERFVGGAWSGD